MYCISFSNFGYLSLFKKLFIHVTTELLLNYFLISVCCVQKNVSDTLNLQNVNTQRHKGIL